MYNKNYKPTQTDEKGGVDMYSVKSLRGLMGLTQKKMAKELGISETQYRAKENGYYDFTQSEMKSFYKLLRPYEINIGYEEIFFVEGPTQTDSKERV